MVEALIDQLPEDNATSVISVKQESVPGSPNGQRPSAPLSKYNPSITYILEFCTLLAIRDAETIDTMGKLVFDTVQGVLRDSSQYHAITISRAAFCALSILKASYVSFEHNYCIPHANGLIGSRLRERTIPPTYNLQSATRRTRQAVRPCFDRAIKLCC